MTASPPEPAAVLAELERVLASKKLSPSPNLQNLLRHLVEKTVNLRIFPDDEGRFDRSALDVAADLLVVSQFTLYGDTRKGRRPSFVDAAPPEAANALFEKSVKLYRDTGLRVETGVFQTHMVVSIENDGPVTIWLDSTDRRRPRRG